MKTTRLELDLRQRIENIATLPNENESAALDRLVGELSTATLRYIARRWLFEQVQSARRAATLRIERIAVMTPEPQVDPTYLPKTDPIAEAFETREDNLHWQTKKRLKWKHGSMAKQFGAALAGCRCRECAPVAEWEARSRARFETNIMAIMQNYAADLRIEWTTELLEAGISLPDGSRTTWGAATIEQHQTRIDMLTHNAVANAEAAARHRVAIDMLQEANASCLNDVVHQGV